MAIQTFNSVDGFSVGPQVTVIDANSNVTANTFLATADANIQGNLEIGSNLSITGNLDVVNVNEYTSATGNITFFGNMLPSTSNTFSLGSPSKNWVQLYTSNLNVTGTLNVDTVAASSVTGTNITGSSTVNTDTLNAQTVLAPTIGNSSSQFYGVVSNPNQTGITTLGTLGNLTVTSNINVSNINVGTVYGNLIGHYAVPGNDSQVLFNDNGNMNTSPGFTFDKTSNAVGMSGNLIAAAVSSPYLTATTLANVQSLSVLTSAYVGYDMSVNGNITTAANVVITGDMTVGGNVNILGNVQQISGNSGQFFGNSITGLGALYAGIVSGYANIDTAVLQVSSDYNGYTQVNNQNINAGNVSSTDYVITSNFGDDTSFYLDIGMTSSGWDASQTNSLGNALGAADGYMYVKDGNLVAGTATAGKQYKVIVGGSDSRSIVARFNAPNTTSSSTTSGSMILTGGLGVSQTVTSNNAVVIANVSAGNVNVTSTVNGSLGNFNLVTGTLTTNAQPNITTVGNLSYLNVDNSIQSGNIYANSGTVGASLITGTLTTAAQPNVTSLGTLSSLSVSTNVSASTLTGTLTTSAQPNITSVGTLSSLSVSSSVNASTLGGSLTTAAQPNVTSVGTLNSLSVTNGINAGSVSASTLGGTLTTGSQTNITAIGTLNSLNVSTSVSASTLGGSLTTAAQPNITSVGTLSSLSVTGTASSGNVSTTNATLSGILQAPQLTKASTATGTTGQICWDANFIYVCTSTNTWKRVALTGGY